MNTAALAGKLIELLPSAWPMMSSDTDIAFVEALSATTEVELKPSMVWVIHCVSFAPGEASAVVHKSFRYLSLPLSPPLDSCDAVQRAEADEIDLIFQRSTPYSLSVAPKLVNEVPL